jgi:hypothetical protein
VPSHEGHLPAPSVQIPGSHECPWFMRMHDAYELHMLDSIRHRGRPGGQQSGVLAKPRVKSKAIHATMYRVETVYGTTQDFERMPSQYVT